MKQYFATGLLILLAVFSLNTAQAQIFTGGIGVIGTSNAPVQNTFVIQTNVAFVSLSPRTLQLVGISTNEVVTNYYGTIFSGIGIAPVWIGATNILYFPASNGFTMGQTFTTNFPGINLVVPITPIGQINIYSNGVAISNSVSLQ